MSAAVSVVVPTRDRPESLHACLAALRRDAGPGVEVVVADDGSRDAPAVARAAAVHGAELLRLDRLGPAAARNRGAARAAGEVVLFLDDDCAPRSGWSGRLADAAARSGVAAGRTVAPTGAGAAVVASQTVIDHLMLDGLDAATLRFAPSCNLGLSRAAVEAIPFDEGFPHAAGEDREWSARAIRAGLAPTYAPEAVVVHDQSAGTRVFLERQLRYGRGAEQLRRRGLPLSGGASRAALVRRAFAAGGMVGALTLLGQAATAAGLLAERVRPT